MNIIIFGATGTVGGEVVRGAIKDPEIQKITAIVRRPLEIADAKLEIIQHQNFLNYSGLENVFINSNAVLWCLGVSEFQVNKEEYIKITYDYTIAAAKEILKANPEVTFLFLSGQGADQEENVPTLFGKIKGRTEKALSQLPFKNLYIARPAGIEPIHLNKNTSLFNKLVAPLFPILKFFAPYYVITSVELAKALIKMVKIKPKAQLFNNERLKQLSK